MKIFKFSLIFLAVFFILFTHPTKAIETGQLGILPARPDPAKPMSASWFIYEAKPGSMIEDIARINNHNLNSSIRIKIYAVDGTTTSNGVFALSLITDQQKGIGSWIEILPPQTEGVVVSPTETTAGAGATESAIMELDIPAGKSLEVPFKLTIPDNASVGDHTGGIVIEALPEEKEGTGFKVVTRIGARVYLTIPGEKIYQLSAKNFAWNIVDYTAEELERLFLGKTQRFLGLYRKGNFSVQLENLGNVQLGTYDVPIKGKLVIKNIVNQIIDEKELDLGTILPKGKITQNLSWKRNNPLFLRYRADLSITYANNKSPETIMLYFWVIPWPLLLAVGILIILIIILCLVIRLLKEMRKKKMAQYTVQLGDTIKKISDIFAIKPEKIIKVNRLKIPYEINIGQKLCIPKIKQKQLDEIVKGKKALVKEKISKDQPKSKVNAVSKVVKEKKTIKPSESKKKKIKK